MMTNIAIAAATTTRIGYDRGERSQRENIFYNPDAIFGRDHTLMGG